MDTFRIKALDFCCDEMMVRFLVSRMLHIELITDYRTNLNAMDTLGYLCMEHDQSEKINYCYSCGNKIEFILHKGRCD